MTEKFDFSKLEDQNKFDQLPNEEKSVQIEDAHREALILNEIRDGILEFYKGNEASEEVGRKEAASKIRDIFNDADVAVHSTKITHLYDILKLGLLSIHQLKKLGINNCLCGPDVQESFGMPDSISITTNYFRLEEDLRGQRQNVKEQLTKWSINGFSQAALIHLIFDFNVPEFTSKFYNFSQPIKRPVPVRGKWDGEYLADGSIEVELLRGIAIEKDLLQSTITGVLDVIIRSEKAKQLEQYETDFSRELMNWQRKKEVALREIENIEDVFNKLNDIGIVLINIESTEDHSIYKIEIEIDGKPYFIEKKGGKLDIPQELEELIKSKFSDRPDEADRYLEIFGLSSNPEATVDSSPLSKVMSTLRRLIRKDDGSKLSLADKTRLHQNLIDLLSGEEPKKNFEYKKTDATKQFEQMAFMLTEIFGDISLGKILELLGRKLKIPIYAVDCENEEFQVVYPKNLLVEKN